MKEIKLTQGKVALVDDEDYEYLSQFKWFAHKDYSTFYAGRSTGRHGKQIWMHREILGTPDGLIVDHIDHNGLNNQKYNLRNCTHGDNIKNKVTHNTIGYLGVSYYNPKRKKTKPFRATIWINGRNIHLGTFGTAEDAAIAYNKAALKYHGDFANLNIINSDPLTVERFSVLYKETH